MIRKSNSDSNNKFKLATPLVPSIVASDIYFLVKLMKTVALSMTKEHLKKAGLRMTNYLARKILLS